MSAAEIITVIKAINDHVTVKYCGVIVDYLTEKKKAQLLFERKFYNEMDKAVQVLLNNIATLLNPTGPKNEIMQKIQIHCTRYNNWKKNKYDDHLLKIGQLEKSLDEFLKKTFNEKLGFQDSLFNDALSTTLNQNTLHQDVVPEKQKKQQYMNSNLDQRADDDNLFNDNITNSTIFSNSSLNINDNKTTQQISSDEEKSQKTHQNTHNNNNISIQIPNINFPPFPPFPPLPQIQVANNINHQLQLNGLTPPICRYNNQLPLLPSTNKHNAKGNNNINTANKSTNNIAHAALNSTVTEQKFAWSTNKPVQIQTNFSAPVAPPKPPPPTVTVHSSDSELSDTSNLCSSDANINNTEHYKCHLCDQEFTARLRWESHLKTHQFSNMIKKKVVTKTVSKSKRKKKRNFGEINADDSKLDVTNKSSKRSCHRYQCEYCDKKYFRQAAYIKHYNNHMITNKNSECNFCFHQFKVKQDLTLHVGEFNAGMTPDGFYQCCQCTMRFERKNELTSHISWQHKMNSAGVGKRNEDIDCL